MAEHAAGPRAIWKGAISFGLVHVPVSLHSATQEQEVDFDWLDKRSMDPVGYKRINKRTGKEIAKHDIVKGVKLEGDEYVVLSDDEIKAAYPKRTQTIQIETFVKAADVSFVYIEKPYYLAPDAKAQRVYALLREALEKAGVIGIARFVLHNKEHLAALIPAGPALMLGTLRWAEEIRSPEALDLPKPGAAGLKPAELKMAQQLIAQMTDAWKPEQFKDDFSSAIRELVAAKAKAGKKQTVQPFEEAPDTGSANVVDLTELLRQSLGGKSGKTKSAAKKAPAAKSPRGRKAA
ncbi:DNA end-binding protein Ku [Pelomonas aquatica]|uniref:Non-homologous end joining protein Ku n=1 Tax=Pelomonas aquatica TaxID=431058 RepID=A0ABU1ZEF9_9BURK|nr:Ku protein [Pelomonas aquatica]MDR7298997.1 DNA end-binding protein Ku [Pelomonas aquatica]